MEFSQQQVDEFLLNGKAIDATNGGLVWGRSHDEGGIYFLVKKNDVYYLEGELEGFEYILNPGASHYFDSSMHHFHNMEKYGTKSFIPYLPSGKITLIDTKREKFPRYLVFELGGFSIINKYSTKDYLSTLDEMNKSVSYEVIDSKTLKTNVLSRKDIQVYFDGIRVGYFPMGTTNGNS